MKLITRKKREYDDDGLLPLVNIIFLLLIFFMIAGVIEKRIVKDDIELPAAELNRFENKEITKIFINKSNIFFINNNAADIDEVSAYLKSNKINEVVIIADKSLYINDVNILLTKLHENNIKNIKLLSNTNAN
jgi:biopolymer transport protein ExbD|tara:strand:- start:688 stop:1086 length:399 start_codon:yes stop_codon:yes gene_type:complete